MVESDSTYQVFILLANIGTFTYVSALSQQSHPESLTICTEDCVALPQVAAPCWEIYS